MGPQWTLSEAFDLLSGRTEFQTQNGLEVNRANAYVVFSVLPGCYCGVRPWSTSVEAVAVLSPLDQRPKHTEVRLCGFTRFTW